MDMMNFGYMVYQMIDAMEMANIRTEVTIGMAVDEPNYMPLFNFYEMYIKLKKAGDPIWPEKLLFQLVHPSMFYRLMVSAMEKEPAPIRERYGFYTYGGYGQYNPDWTPAGWDDTLVVRYSSYAEQRDTIIGQVRAMILAQADKIR